FWCIVVTCAGTVLLLSIWRLAVFSDVLPNTFWAKRWPPYADFGPLGRLTGAVELPSFFLVPLIAIAIMWRAGLKLAVLWQARRGAILILGGPIVGALLVGGLIGKHWGYH